MATQSILALDLILNSVTPENTPPVSHAPSQATQLPSLTGTLSSTFGYHEFRDGQQDVIEAILSGQDALVLMPTGGGKSLCYQLPAIMLPGITIVVSPLIALMKDQVESLSRLGVSAATINSSLSNEETHHIFMQARNQQLKMLYVAPEKLLQPRFMEQINQLGVSLIAIDEAHCISQWGHDFRPEYARLGELKRYFPAVPIIALTATADVATRGDIASQLRFENPFVSLGSFDRPNIRYIIQEKLSPINQIRDYIRNRKSQSGIVYCGSRKRVDDYAEKLKSAGISAAGYHAGMDNIARAAVQDGFLRDDIQVVVATVAFGMGIHKPDIRFVVHADVPKTIEGYYQETGRAGRDGLVAEAMMLFEHGDIGRIRHLIEYNEDEARRQVEHQRFSSMAAFAEAQTCRRQVLLNYFAEQKQTSCGNCDICLDPPKQFDGTKLAQMALSCIYRAGQQFGITYIVDVLRGSSIQRIKDNKHDKLSTWGIGKEQSNDYWLSIIRQLIHQGLVNQDIAQHAVLKLTEAARPVLKGEVALMLAEPRLQTMSREKQKPSIDYDRRLFALLRKLRKDIADEEGVPPYIVFNDNSLIDMAAQQPVNEQEFLAISGVGYSKLSRYGDPFLTAIRSFQVRYE